MSDLTVPLVVGLVAILSPLLLSTLNTRQQRLMKREDYARQDVVAERVEAAAIATANRQDAIAAATAEAARLLLEKQNAIATEVRGVAARAEVTAGLLVEANAEVAGKVATVAISAGQVADKVAIVAENADKVNEKLDVIHTLVNSSMTAAIQSQYDDKVEKLAMMREMMRMSGKPNADMTAAIKATEIKIAELKETLDERHRQDELAKAQVVKIVAAEGLHAERNKGRGK